MTKPVLETAAQDLADATANPPFLYELDLEGARKALDDLRATPVEKLDGGGEVVTVTAAVVRGR